MTTEIEIIEQNKSFNGQQIRYSHRAKTLNCNMNFSVYLPPKVCKEQQAAPVLYWLSGLTCTDQNFVQKAGAQRIASELGIIIVAPDTSPRGDDIPDDPEKAYDFGLGAGFYVNATETPWDKNYQMYDYIRYELPELINTNFNTNGQQSIAGHSMGGHGALVLGLRNQDFYAAISAFSPICNPINCPWGQKALGNYLGEDKQAWKKYDACELLQEFGTELNIKIDQGADDQFLRQQLLPENLIRLADQAKLNYQLHEGYDHSYFFIASFIEDHLRFHFEDLK